MKRALPQLVAILAEARLGLFERVRRRCSSATARSAAKACPMLSSRNSMRFAVTSRSVGSVGLIMIPIVGRTPDGDTGTGAGVCTVKLPFVFSDPLFGHFRLLGFAFARCHFLAPIQIQQPPPEPPHPPTAQPRQPLCTAQPLQPPWAQPWQRELRSLCSLHAHSPLVSRAAADGP